MPSTCPGRPRGRLRHSGGPRAALHQGVSGRCDGWPRCQPTPPGPDLAVHGDDWYQHPLRGPPLPVRGGGGHSGTEGISTAKRPHEPHTKQNHLMQYLGMVGSF